MTITWTKCSEQMPPNDIDVIISDCVESWIRIRHGAIVNNLCSRYADYRSQIVSSKWAPYTPEAWEELNNPDKRWLDDLPEFLKKQAD